MMPRTARIAIGIVGIAALFIIVLLGYSEYANRAAFKEATEFCQRARPGEAITALVAAGGGLKIRPIYDRERSQYVFVFPGFGMDKAFCTVRVSRDKIESATAQMFYD